MSTLTEVITACTFALMGPDSDGNGSVDFGLSMQEAFGACSFVVLKGYTDAERFSGYGSDGQGTATFDPDVYGADTAAPKPPENLTCPNPSEQKLEFIEAKGKWFCVPKP